ncbi:MAG: helical backbone metal receptor [Anaerolineaceae bacterium]|nr:helical backbone metal receptor [Anaerolineaceae bacterium]
MNGIPIDSAPKRVVSLIPSTTESLFDLGFGDSVVGISDYCTEPARRVSSITRVGGPKNVRVQDILKLKPDLVIANQEENSREDVEELRQYGIPVWVTFPKTIRQSLDDLWALSELYHRQVAMDRLRSLETALDYARLAVSDVARVKYFCPIWEEESAEKRWWITFAAETYPNDLLSLFGGENVFKDRSKLDVPETFPVEAGKDLSQAISNRYPKVTLDEIFMAEPEVILLPSEPYPYSYQHAIDYRKLFLQKSAANSIRSVRWLDGSLIAWHGTRLARSLQELTGIFSS